MDLRYHIHEWLADHIKWVQYPGVIEVRPSRRPLFRWKYGMPLSTRITLAMLSTFWGIVLTGVLVAMLFVGWAFIGAALGFH